MLVVAPVPWTEGLFISTKRFLARRCLIQKQGSTATPLEGRQLTVLLHGNPKRLIKATTDMTAPQRILRLLMAWASAHALIDTSTAKATIVSVSHVLCEEFGHARGGLLGASIASLSGPATSAASLRQLVRPLLVSVILMGGLFRDASVSSCCRKR